MQSSMLGKVCRWEGERHWVDGENDQLGKGLAQGGRKRAEDQLGKGSVRLRRGWS